MKFFRIIFLSILLTLFLGFLNKTQALNMQNILISKVSNSALEISNFGEDFQFSKIEIIQNNQNIGEISNGIFLKKSQILFSKKDGDGKILSQDLLSEQIELKIDGEKVDFFCAENMKCEEKNAPEITKDNILTRNFNKDIFEISQKKVIFGSGGLAEIEEDFCENLQISEVLINSNEQFLELKNTKNQKISLKKCGIEIYVGNNKETQKINFKDIEILPNDFLTINFNSENSFKFSKTGNNKIILLNSKNQEIQSVELKGSKKNLSWIFDGKEWQQSFKITKNSKNIFQPCEDGFNLNSQGQCEKIKVCEDGYFLNEETGRCNKIKEEKLEKEKTEKIENDEKTEKKCSDGYFLNPQTNRCNKIPVEKVATAECRDGYVRSPETNRCRKIATLASSLKELAVCAPGYTRNPITNRCRKNSSDAKKEITPCKDGYERNPETNRCRKIVKNNGANNEVEKAEKESKQAEFTGWWAIAIIILIFLAILFFEFRRDIFAKLMKGKK